MNPAIFEALESGKHVVTATRRLRHELAKAYNQHQISQDRKVWPTAQISTWDGWIQALWEAASIYTNHVLLSHHQVREILSQIIEEDLETRAAPEPGIQALWNIPATAKTALAAWQLCHQWQIPFSRLQDTPNDDHASFGRWASKLYGRLQQQSWVSHAQLADQLIKMDVCSRESVILFGFDQFDKQQEAYIAFSRQAGVKLTRLNNDTGAAVRLRRFSFDTAQEEWRHIGAWARDHLENLGSNTLGIITPDISANQAIAAQALREQLIPAYFNDQSADPFHFSIGNNLLTTPVIRDALSCLELLGTMTFPQLETVFLSSYWGQQDEQILRAELAIKLRNKIAFEFDLFKLLQTLERYCEQQYPEHDTAVKFLEKLQALQSNRQSLRARQAITLWRDLFSRCLSLLGWPGENLDSAEYQALQAWEKCLEDWSRLDIVCRPLSLDQALISLRKHCSETVFQPQMQNDAPIQIMGVLETAGLDFDAVWLAGFDESSWPPPTSVNPFIPIALQIERGVPEASLSLKHELARTRTHELCHLAPEVNFSHARIQDDIRRTLSSLLPDMACSSPADLPEVFVLERALRIATPDLISLEDNTGTVFPDTQVKGGTGLIQKQSVCPFSAYAHHRLNAADDERPGIGMNNMQRGSLLHSVMESIWEELGNLDALLQHFDQGTVDELIRGHTDKQLRYFARNSGLGEGYEQAEKDRLAVLVREWLDIEQQRLPFRVIATEHKTNYQTAGLQLTIKIDRIDEINLPESDTQTARLIMDYKSGRCELKDWASDRPAQPQVPLYMLAMEQDNSLSTEALAFAQLRHGESAFVGVTRVDGTLPEVGSLDMLGANNALKKTYPDWATLESGWRKHIESLVLEFKEGIATVDPRHNACQWCKLGPLCRIHTHDHEEVEHDLD